MTNPSPEQLQRQIALVQRWTKFSVTGDDRLWGYDPSGECRHVPNWPGSLDAARGLEIINKGEFIRCLYDVFVADGIILESDNKETREIDRIAASLMPMLTFIDFTAYQWCLAWLLYMGWRWEMCGACDDGVVETDHDAGIPDTESKCTHCNGEGGRWIKV